MDKRKQTGEYCPQCGTCAHWRKRRGTAPCNSQAWWQLNDIAMNEVSRGKRQCPGYSAKGSPANEAAWRSYGAALYRLRHELVQIMCNPAYQELLPLKPRAELSKALNHLDRFRDIAEEEMFRRGGPRDIKVWYPGGTHAEVANRVFLE